MLVLKLMSIKMFSIYTMTKYKSQLFIILRYYINYLLMYLEIFVGIILYK